MTHGCRTLLGALAAVIAAVWLASALGAQREALPGKPWTGKTPWGDPDLQGIWANDTPTNLERLPRFAGKAVLTDDEFKEELKLVDRVNTLRDRSEGAGTESVGVGSYNQFWRRNIDKPLRRTSLIVDPPDGRIPPLTPEALEKYAAFAKARGLVGDAAKAQRNMPQSDGALNSKYEKDFVDNSEGGVDGRGTRADNPEDRWFEERCVTRGLIKLPGGNNPYYEILQAPGYVVIHAEAGNEFRIVPLDGRPHLPSRVRQWLGDSRGRWEGNTLVIDTINLTDKAPFFGSFEGLHAVERLTRVDADTIDVKLTVDDPTAWTSPWTFQHPLTNMASSYLAESNAYKRFEIFEYACHEGSYGTMVGILSGQRMEERGKAEAAKKRPTAKKGTK